MDTKKRIEELKEELNNLRLITGQIFDTSEELQQHVNKNIDKYTRARDIQIEIKKLELSLLSPEEIKKIEEQRRLSKLKREGKLF